LFLQDDTTVLMCTARNGCADVAEALVAAGANKNATDTVSRSQNIHTHRDALFF
jgi:ankyrin repeat protein